MNPAPIRVTELPRLSPRPADSHKGRNGRVAILAGSRGMSGAALLAGRGALRGGAGLVQVAAPRSVQPILAAAEPCLMTRPLDEDGFGCLSLRACDALPDLLGWANVMAAGPGLGVGDGVAGVIDVLLVAAQVPIVLDADALNVLARRPNWWTARGAAPLVLTPHPGEFERLARGAGASAGAATAQSAVETRVEQAVAFASKTGCVVVLKGYQTVVAAADRCFVNETGNPGMATGGMGDVLTGLIAALIGQGLAPFDAAVLATHVHGAAADECARRIGPIGYLAREVADALPAALEIACRAPLGFR